MELDRWLNADVGDLIQVATDCLAASGSGQPNQRTPDSKLAQTMMSQIAPVLRDKHVLHAVEPGSTPLILRISVHPEEAADRTIPMEKLALVAGLLDIDPDLTEEKLKTIAFDPFVDESQSGVCYVKGEETFGEDSVDGEAELVFRYRWHKGSAAVTLIQGFLARFDRAEVIVPAPGGGVQSVVLGDHARRQYPAPLSLHTLRAFDKLGIHSFFVYCQ